MIELPETPPHIEILFQNENYVVVNKPAGLLVHPYKGKTHDPYTLMSLVRDQIGQRVNPIHRLDRPVSGVVLFCLSGKLVANLQLYWHRVDTEKEYITMCRGIVEEKGVFNFALKDNKKGKRPVAPKPAKTLYWPLLNFKELDTSLMRVQIRTGRQHQIRRHFSRRMFNLIGDTKYGKGPINHKFADEFKVERLFLHCHRLRICDPETEEFMEFRAPLAPDLVEALKLMDADLEKIKNYL